MNARVIIIDNRLLDPDLSAAVASVCDTMVYKITSADDTFIHI